MSRTKLSASAKGKGAGDPNRSEERGQSAPSTTREGAQRTAGDASGHEPRCRRPTERRFTPVGARGSARRVWFRGARSRPGIGIVAGGNLSAAPRATCRGRCSLPANYVRCHYKVLYMLHVGARTKESHMSKPTRLRCSACADQGQAPPARWRPRGTSGDTTCLLQTLTFRSWSDLEYSSPLITGWDLSPRRTPFTQTPPGDGRPEPFARSHGWLGPWEQSPLQLGVGRVRRRPTPPTPAGDAC